MIELIPQAQVSLEFESYPAPEQIDGVWVQALRKFRSENGWFMEYARLESGKVENTPSSLELRQVSVSQATAGRINAFHIHTKLEQNEIWTVIEGQLQVWLVDLRASSRTVGVRRKLLLSGEQPVQVFIPAGVAHGYRAGPGGAVLLYAMDQQFNSSDPNEGRLPWDFFGAELWAENKG